MRLVNVMLQQRGPLTNEQIAAVYELAERLRVGIFLPGNNTPRQAVFIWSVSGGLIRILRFARALRNAGMR
ncbi:hypothetical protein ACI8AA_01305 [Geodermatophilus sp. SYSU D01180]